MEKFEIELKGIAVDDIESLLKLMDVRSENIISCHFFIDNQDVYRYENVNFNHYFAQPSTCYFHLKKVFLGSVMEDAVLIISGNASSVEMTCDFPYSLELYQMNNQQILDALQTFRAFADSVSLGSEPLDDSDILLVL